MRPAAKRTYHLLKKFSFDKKKVCLQMPPTNNVGIEEVYVTKDSDEVSVIRKIKFTTGAPSELTKFVSGT